MGPPMSHEAWMRRAIELSRAGLATGQSPFGAVIVRGDELIAAGHNEVWKRTDPTAHAEVVCIQRAAATLRAIDLSGCRMYTTCEPCPMCAAAIHWSGLDEVFFGATISDAARAGFKELHLGAPELLARGGSRVAVHSGLLARECSALFDEWLARPDHRPY